MTTQLVQLFQTTHLIDRKYQKRKLVNAYKVCQAIPAFEKTLPICLWYIFTSNNSCVVIIQPYCETSSKNVWQWQCSAIYAMADHHLLWVKSNAQFHQQCFVSIKARTVPASPVTTTTCSLAMELINLKRHDFHLLFHWCKVSRQSDLANN